MALDKIQKDLIAAENALGSYLKHTEEYVELKMFQVFMRTITWLVKVMLVGATVFIAILVLSLAAALGIGQTIGNTSHGFLIIGGFYVLLVLVCLLLRHKLDAPLIKRFSNYYFK